MQQLEDSARPCETHRHFRGLKIRKNRKEKLPAAPQKIQFSCEISLLLRQVGDWMASSAIYGEFSPFRTIFVEKTSLLVFLFFLIPFSSHRSLVSCCCSGTSGTRRFRSGEKTRKCSGGRRCVEGIKRKETVVLWFMKGWKMELPCLPRSNDCYCQ